MIVVADLHQLKDRQNDVYQVDGTKVVERKGMKVEQSYVDRVNGSSEVSGKLFVVDKQATEDWKIDNEKHVTEVKDAAEKAKLGLTEIAEALINKSGDVEPKKRQRRTKDQIEADKQD